MSVSTVDYRASNVLGTAAHSSALPTQQCVWLCVLHCLLILTYNWLPWIKWRREFILPPPVLQRTPPPWKSHIREETVNTRSGLCIPPAKIKPPTRGAIFCDTHSNFPHETQQRNKAEESEEHQNKAENISNTILILKSLKNKMRATVKLHEIRKNHSKLK